MKINQSYFDGNEGGQKDVPEDCEQNDHQAADQLATTLPVQIRTYDRKILYLIFVSGNLKDWRNRIEDDPKGQAK